MAAATPVHRCPPGAAAAAAAHAHLQTRPCHPSAAATASLRHIHACQPSGCSVGSGGAGGGSLALDLDGVLLDLPPESPSATGGRGELLPQGPKKCRLWAPCVVAAMFVFGAKFYLDPQILAKRTILEVVMLCAVFCFVSIPLLFGCLSLCRSKARALLAAAVASSQPQPPAPLLPLRPPLSVPLPTGTFALPPPPPSHPVAPLVPHEDGAGDLHHGAYVALPASGHATAAFGDVPEVSVVPTEPPPPPYHVAVLLPSQCDDAPPPSYDKAVS